MVTDRIDGPEVIGVEKQDLVAIGLANDFAELAAAGVEAETLFERGARRRHDGALVEITHEVPRGVRVAAGSASKRRNASITDPRTGRTVRTCRSDHTTAC